MEKPFLFEKFKKNIHVVTTLKKRKVIFMNPHSYVSIFKDKSFRDAVENCTNIYIDGAGIYNLIKLKYFF